MLGSTKHYQPCLLSDPIMLLPLLPSPPLRWVLLPATHPHEGKEPGKGSFHFLSVFISLPKKHVGQQSHYTAVCRALCQRRVVSGTWELKEKNKKALPIVKLGKQRSWKFIHFSHLFH